MANSLNPTKSNSSNRLTVPPRHSYSTSVSSSSNVSPSQFIHTTNGLRNKQGSSSMRLSRTNTETTDAYVANQDNQSIQTIDKIPSAKPSVTYQDRLWTQIDVLDDVKKMAQEVRSRGSFFDDKFRKEMSKLKQSQEKLIQTMSQQGFDDMNISEVQNQQLYQLNTNSLQTPTTAMTRTTTNIITEDDNSHNNTGAEGEEEDKAKLVEMAKKQMDQEKITKFFANDEFKFENLKVYDKTTFDEINGYVQQVKQDLMELGKAIKEFDDSTKNIW
ncbi:hypothetical protein KGF56_001968 [Candida oxycetoniae]|uniref:Uncharacterized protein n=1 Tax=Candida oxycetoniae TaxID=497107 RepID=A0AAI9SYP4_9ASCO|nr:uncharacterized protein KGF56_001968 [Candida oxycetoniae]KAI3405224.2 hypothetical protein KGF56_001968 [Candida oxycetoniae]